MTSWCGNFKMVSPPAFHFFFFFLSFLTEQASSQGQHSQFATAELEFAHTAQHSSLASLKHAKAIYLNCKRDYSGELWVNFDHKGLF